jgi:hypothetical protein
MPLDQKKRDEVRRLVAKFAADLQVDPNAPAAASDVEAFTSAPPSRCDQASGGDS